MQIVYLLRRSGAADEVKVHHVGPSLPHLLDDRTLTSATKEVIEWLTRTEL